MLAGIGSFDLTGMYRLTKFNGYHIPAMNNPFVSMSWLARVLKHEVTIPLRKNIVLGTCNKAPPVTVIFKALQDVEVMKGITFGLRERGPKPPSAWMLDILSTYCP